MDGNPGRPLTDDAALTEAARGAPAAFYTFRLFPSGEYALPFVSPIFAARYGVGQGAPVEMANGFFARIHPDDRGPVREKIARSASTLEPIDVEFRFRHLSGAEVWVETRSYAERAADGGVVWHGIATDITARKAAEADLRHRKSQFRAVLETLQDSYFRTNLEGRFVLLSPSTPKMYGYGSVDEMLGQSAEILYAHPEHRQRALAEIREKGYVRDRIGKVRRKDGSTFWVSLNAQPWFDESGRLAGVEGVARDITARMETEEALRRSEERYRSFLEEIPIGIFRTTPDGRILLANPALVKMLGYDSLDDLRHRNLEQQGFEPGYSREEFKQTIERDGEIRGRESAWTRKDGNVLFVRESARAVRGPDGKVLYYDGTVEDITERRQTESALRESEERYRSLVEGSSNAVMLHSEGRFVFVNPAAVKLFGASSPEQLLGQPILERVHPDFRNPVKGRIVSLHGGLPIPEMVERFLKLDGSEIEVEVTASRVSLKGKETIQVEARDVTERRKAESALRGSEERYRRIVENATEGIWVVDGNLRTTLANRAFARMLGYEPKEMIGTPATTYSFPENLDELGRHMDARRRGVEETYERRFRRKDGRECWCLLSATPMFDYDGRFAGSFGMLNDITERRSLQEQLRQSQKMEAVGLLAGGIAHDFNNLLTVITGNIEMLLSMLRPEDPTTLIAGEIRHAGERAAALTRQLLAFSRKQVLAPKVVDLNDIVSGAEKMLRRLIGEDVALTCLLDPRLSPVKVDPAQIEQVILNLAVNARDAMPRGGSLTIETRNTSRSARPPGDRPHVLLTVSDTGTGMSADVKAHLFEPFFTTKEAGKGSGLGLATVYGVVKQSDGDIAVESEPGVGTTFRILIPAVEPTRLRPVSDHRIRAIPRGDETVLLVEDEEAVRKIVHRILDSSGYRVLVAPSGEEALKIVRGHAGPIHLLVTDVVMPMMGGRELAEILCREYPQTKVLFVSGYTDDAVVRQGIVEERSPFLQKPFSPLTLARKVREILDAGS
ncbi:MAG: PAS domain S-box protein [Thermoanaerobaculia bacterium]